jgi:hypothetical protein
LRDDAEPHADCGVVVRPVGVTKITPCINACNSK